MGAIGSMGEREKTRRERGAELRRLRRRVAELESRLSVAEKAGQRQKRPQKELQALCDVASDFVYRMNIEPDGTASLRWVRGSSAANWGLRIEDITGPDNWKKVVHTTDHVKAERLIENVLSGTQRGVELRAVTNAGETRWLEVSASPLWDEAQERVTSLLGTARDITDRKHTGKALRRSEAKYREIAETVDELIYRAAPHTFEPTFVNQAVEKFYGYSVEEWLNRPALWQDHIHPEDRERVREGFREAREARKPGRLEYRVTRRDGTVRWVEDRFNWEVDRRGEVVAMDGVVYDLTERKNAQEQLRRSEQRFRHIFEQAAVGIAQVAPDGVIKQANERFCRMVGYPEDELTGMRFQTITHPDDLDADLDYVHRLLEGDISRYCMEKRYLAKNGDVVWVILCVGLVRDEMGEPDY
ncbi:MAG: PAS domain S-box protein, partial [Planctomycetota bacterium]